MVKREPSLKAKLSIYLLATFLPFIVIESRSLQKEQDSGHKAAEISFFYIEAGLSLEDRARILVIQGKLGGRLETSQLI